MFTSYCSGCSRQLIVSLALASAASSAVAANAVAAAAAATACFCCGCLWHCYCCYYCWFCSMCFSFLPTLAKAHEKTCEYADMYAAAVVSAGVPRRKNTYPYHPTRCIADLTTARLLLD